MENNINIDIVDYMGKFKEGVFVMLSVNYNNEFYEGTLFYTETDVRLTVDSRIEESLGCTIENWDGYMNLLEKTLRKCVPYSEIISRLDEVNFDDYVDLDLLNEDEFVDEFLNEDEIDLEDEDKGNSN